jgi:hypothetical protein
VAMEWLRSGYGVATEWLRSGYGGATEWLRSGYGVAMEWLRRDYRVALEWLWSGYGGGSMESLRSLYGVFMKSLQSPIRRNCSISNVDKTTAAGRFFCTLIINLAQLVLVFSFFRPLLFSFAN